VGCFGVSSVLIVRKIY